MGQRFGHDFANVRIHTDRTAADTAHAIGARAFTVGRHIAFADGEYTGGGLRLLAHELAHAVQQDRAGRADDTRGLHIDHAGSSREDEADRAADAVLAGRRPAIALHADADALQRQGKPVQTKTDVALVLAGDDISSAEGGALAPVVLRITSLTDLCKQVDGVGKAIGTMFVISHASSDGTLRIEGASGSQIPLKMANLAAALKKCTRIPHTVDFRGCKVGAAGDEVEKFRDASGVATVIATDCPKFSARSAPIPVDGVGATKPSQGPKTPEGIVAFDASLVQHANALAADNGKSVAHCLLGLPSGTLPRNGNILTLRKLYWANAGQFVASWASPIDNRNWQTQSRCMKDLTATSSPCARVEKKAPAPANSPTKAPTKNKGAMLAPDALPRLALDTLAASDESLA